MDERLWQLTAGWKHRALKLWGATEAPSPSAPRGFGICPDLGGSWAEALGLLSRARWYRGAPVALWDPNAAREPWQQQQQLLGSRRCCCAGLLEGLGCSWCAPNQSWLKRVLKEINQRFRVASYQIDWNGWFFFSSFPENVGFISNNGIQKATFCIQWLYFVVHFSVRDEKRAQDPYPSWPPNVKDLEWAASKGGTRQAFLVKINQSSTTIPRISRKMFRC